MAVLSAATASRLNCPLPIPAKIYARLRSQRQADHALDLGAVSHAAAVLAPCYATKAASLNLPDCEYSQAVRGKSEARLSNVFGSIFFVLLAEQPNALLH